MRSVIALVVFSASFPMLQGIASAEEPSLNDQCRATIRAEMKGPACRKSDVDQLGDRCYISPLEAMKYDMHARIARCVDRRTIRRWNVAAG